MKQHPFTKWINEKYLDWRKNEYGRDVGISAYARYLRLKRGTVNKWLDGSVPDEQETISILAETYPEVYEILNVSISEDQEITREADRWLQKLPKHRQEYYLEEIRKEAQNGENSGVAKQPGLAKTD